jgi:hypothetical protein
MTACHGAVGPHQHDAATVISPVCLDIARVQDFIAISASFQSEDCPQLASRPAFELPNRFAVDAERTAAPTGAEFLCLAPIIHAGPVVYWRWKYIA